MAGTSVRALCGTEHLAGARVVGGQTGLDREVISVAVISTLAAAESVGAGAFVIAAPGTAEGNITDVLLRAARAGGAVAFLVPETAWVVRSTARLADRLGTPLLAAVVSDPFQLALQLDRVVRAPDLHRAEVLNRLTCRIGMGPATPRRILEALSAVLSVPSALLGADGALLAGEDLAMPQGAVSEPKAPWRGVVRIPDEHGGEAVLVPITLSGDSAPELWLAVKMPPGPRSRTKTAEQAALLASWAVSAWAAGQRLEGERDARERTQLLSAMLEKPGVIDRQLAERVLRAGWRLEGWHTGAYLRMTEPSGSPLMRYTEFLHAALAENGLTGSLVERAAGWALWLTVVEEPSTLSDRQLAGRMQVALTAIADKLPLVAGLGRPHAGAKGIVLTLQEAYQASLLAGAGAGGGGGVAASGTRVWHIDELGMQRLLADWYTSESFQTYARQLLESLRNSGGEALLRTVEAYLEHESSTSTTAAELRVHRNTVADRISRAERLLGINLSAPDDRLVLQLACRTYRLAALNKNGDDAPDVDAGWQ